MTVLFAVLFFAGAALTAAAGNEVAGVVASGAPATDTSATTTDSSSTAAATDPIVSTDPGQTDPTTDPATTDPATTDPATTETTVTDETTTEATTTQTTAASEPSSTEPAAPGGESTPQPSDGSGQAPASGQAGGAASEPVTGTTSGPQPDGAPQVNGTGPKKPRSTTTANTTPQPVLAPQPGSERDHKKGRHAKASYASALAAPDPSQVEPEGSGSSGSGDIQWINEPLPDPTPPSLRLSKPFADELKSASAANGLDWAFLLAVLRAERPNATGEVSASALQDQAAALAPLHLDQGDREALDAYRHDAVFTQRALVLEHYYRAVGLPALVDGLMARRDQLAAKILADPRIDIYPGGRDDISSGRLDVRVLAMIAFLSESFGDVRVSCLITGHRLYARPGVISAHIYGRAVDIAALDDVSILGHQQPGGITERAIRQILLLPAEMMPKQVISLLGLGGPSFPLADHYNHIHIGY